MARTAGIEPTFSAPVTCKEVEAPLGYVRIKTCWQLFYIDANESSFDVQLCKLTNPHVIAHGRPSYHKTPNGFIDSHL